MMGWKWSVLFLFISLTNVQYARCSSYLQAQPFAEADGSRHWFTLQGDNEPTVDEDAEVSLSVATETTTIAPATVTSEKDFTSDPQETLATKTTTTAPTADQEASLLNDNDTHSINKLNARAKRASGEPNGVCVKSSFGAIGAGGCAAGAITGNILGALVGCVVGGLGGLYAAHEFCPRD